MWTRRDAATVLAAAVVFLAIGLLLFPAAAQPSTSHDAEIVAWYLKGAGDAVVGPRGWTVGRLVCSPRPGAYVACDMRLDSRSSASLCSSGRFKIAGFTVVGQMSAPKRCKAGPSA